MTDAPDNRCLKFDDTKICLSFESCKYFPQFLLNYQQKPTKKVETFGVLVENAYFCPRIKYIIHYDTNIK
jgi:hypothetical protein